MAICAACGEWTEPPVLERGGASAVVIVCPRCRHREPLTQQPLWWVAGAPGSGKSTLAPLLRRQLPDCVVFEGEAIDFWRFEGEPGDYSSEYCPYPARPHAPLDRQGRGRRGGLGRTIAHGTLKNAVEWRGQPPWLPPSALPGPVAT